jgi:tRNA pseudouridine13 synthase
LNVPKIEKEIGVEVYATKSRGIGGRLRQFPEDFNVEEILINGSKAQIEPMVVPQIGNNGRYLVCVLAKRNCDNFLAIQKVAKKLGVNPERIQIAGIKDARAVTAQHISIGRMRAEQVARANFGNIWLYPLHFSNEKIHSNLLFGNQFHIALRAINYASSEILGRIENLQDELLKLDGCPNFFGHQRFGTRRSVTHLVGKHIVLGEWEKAALIFIAKPSLHEHPESRQSRERLWNTRDFERARKYFPFKLVYERQMLNHLARRSRDFVGAFNRLPKKICQLFIQAYQAYLFNKFLSERMQRRLPLKHARSGEYRLEIGLEERMALPLIGYKQSFSSGEQGEIEKQVLEKEEVKPQDFKVHVTPEISAPGRLRTALTPLIGLNTAKPIKDVANANAKRVNIGFTLRKGSYATIILREFMKPANPMRAGF